MDEESATREGNTSSKKPVEINKTKEGKASNKIRIINKVHSRSPYIYTTQFTRHSIIRSVVQGASPPKRVNHDICANIVVDTRLLVPATKLWPHVISCESPLLASLSTPVYTLSS
jgi:hypothetical protein